MPEKSESKSTTGGLTTCETCKEVLRDQKDIELNQRVTHMLRYEQRLQQLYNKFRVIKGLTAVSFDNKKETSNSEIKVNMCFTCHLDAFSSVHDEYISNMNQAAPNSGIFNALGVNTHYVREFGDKEVMMDTKRKFPIKTALHGHQFRASRKFDWDEATELETVTEDVTASPSKETTF